MTRWRVLAEPGFISPGSWNCHHGASLLVGPPLVVSRDGNLALYAMGK